jgi:predicted GNAT family N-acyltransferase
LGCHESGANLWVSYWQISPSWEYLTKYGLHEAGFFVTSQTFKKSGNPHLPMHRVELKSKSE